MLISRASQTLPNFLRALKQMRQFAVLLQNARGAFNHYEVSSRSCGNQVWSVGRLRCTPDVCRTESKHPKKPRDCDLEIACICASALSLCNQLLQYSEIV